MAKRKSKTDENKEVYTEIIPVVYCSDNRQIDTIMKKCGTVRAETYNKLGALQG
jgi:hypothetical protein